MRFETIPLHQLCRTQDPPLVFSQNMLAPLIVINTLQPMPSFDHLDVPQHEEEISKGVDKGMKEKVEELQSVLNRWKELTSSEVLTLMIYVSIWVWNSLLNLEVWIVRSMMEKIVHIPILKSTN